MLSVEYDSFSVVYACFENGDTKNENAWILTRRKEPCSTVLQKARNVLTQKGIDVNNLLDISQLNCALPD